MCVCGEGVRFRGRGHVTSAENVLATVLCRISVLEQNRKLFFAACRKQTSVQSNLKQLPLRKLLKLFFKNFIIFTLNVDCSTDSLGPVCVCVCVAHCAEQAIKLTPEPLTLDMRDVM